MKAKTKSMLMLTSAGLVWGFSFVAIKDSLDYISPLWQQALRLWVAAIPALIVGFIMRKKLTKRLLVRGGILGTLFFGALAFQTVGAQFTSASKTSFLTDSMVAFVPIIEVVFLRRKATLSKIFAAVLCMIGIGLLTLQGRFTIQMGDGLVLMCGIIYACHLLYIEYCEGENPILLHVCQIITAAVLSLVAAMICEPFPMIINIRCGMSILYCGIFEILLGFFLQLAGQQGVSPALAGILLSMECVYASIFAVIFLGDRMSPTMILGGVLILAASVVPENICLKNKWRNREI